MRWILVLICLALAGCGGRPKEVKSFEPKLGEYVGLQAALLPHQSRGYCKPKVVVIDLTTGQVDDAFFMALPEEMRAKDPGEVKSVVWVEWRKQWAGGGKDITGTATKSSFFSLEGHLVVVDVSGAEPVVSYTESYQRTLPKAYRDGAGGGKFRLVKGKEGGWEVETPSIDPKTPHRLIHGTAQGRPPATGGSGENVGEKPLKEMIERLLSLPRG